MTMKAILIPKSSTEPPITLNIDESVSPHLTIALQLSQTGNSYFPVFTQANGTQLEILKIDVVYTGSSDTDFVLWGVTTDGHKPEIEGIQHLASTSMSSQVWWSSSVRTESRIPALESFDNGQRISWAGRVLGDVASLAKRSVPF